MEKPEPAGVPGEKESLSASARSRASFGPLIVVMILLAGLYLLLALFSERLSYGSDRDDYLVAISALRLSHHLSWEPSRMPGFPVFERIVSWVALPGDARGAKATVAVCSLACVVLLLVLGFRSGKDPRIVLLAGILLAVVPLWLQSSFMVMDYSVALFFILGTGVLLELCSSRNVTSAFAISIAAGLLLGLGIGSRLTSAAFLPAAAAACIIDKRTIAAKKVAVLSGLVFTAAASALWFYKPAFDTCGIGFLSSTHVHTSLAYALKFASYQLIGLCGGMVGCGALLALTSTAILTLRSGLVDQLWHRRGWGFRTIFLFAFISTGCYILNPDKDFYFLPLLTGMMLLFIVGLKARHRFLLAVAVLLMAGSSFIQVYPLGFHGLEIRRGQVLDELRRQRMDRSLFDVFQSLTRNRHDQTILIGYPATDRMIAWFYDSTSVAAILPHPFGRTLWGTPTFYPDKVYEIRGMLLADPPLLQSQSTLAKLDTLVEKRGMDTVRLVRSWIQEPVEIPAAWYRGKNCSEVFY